MANNIIGLGGYCTWNRQTKALAIPLKQPAINALWVYDRQIADEVADCWVSRCEVCLRSEPNPGSFDDWSDNPEVDPGWVCTSLHQQGHHLYMLSQHCHMERCVTITILYNQQV